MATDEGIEHDRDGWHNYCSCGFRYWKRASDLSSRRRRRFVGRESSEEHRCEFWDGGTLTHTEEEEDE